MGGEMTQIQQQINALESRVREWEGAKNAAESARSQAEHYDKDSLERKVYMSAEQWRYAREAYSQQSRDATGLYDRANEIRYRIIREWTPYFESATFPDISTAIRFAQLVDKLDRSAGSAIARRAAQTKLQDVSDFVLLISYYEGRTRWSVLR
jgi:hypothetical protein